MIKNDQMATENACPIIRQAKCNGSIGSERDDKLFAR